MITDIEEYFINGCGRCKKFKTPECAARIWHDGLGKLRAICVGLGLEEHVKWGQPCYMHAGRNIALFGALRNDFRLNFFNAALLSDPEGILQKPGPNSAEASILVFTSADQVDILEDTIRAYLKEAMGFAEQGILPEKKTRDVALPDELIDALDADPVLSEAFARLTPGRKKSYAIFVSGAKQAATRITRIEKSRDKIFAGKGAMER